MKTRMTLLICIVLASVLLTACGQTIATPDEGASGDTGLAYQKITADDGKALLDSGAALILVDVRRADEYETAHIPGAVNIPNESIESTQPDALPELEQAIIVYCRTGVRSKQAADKLVEMGYTDVRDMGGIVDWPYDTIAGTEPGEYATVTETETETTETEPDIGTGGQSEPASTGLMGNFSAQDIEGNSINQRIFADYDLTMVNVWATYCGPCLSEMPELGDLAREYESKGVRIVGMVSDVLNSDGSVSNSQLDTVHSIIDETGADYLHILPSQDLYGLMSQITAVPTTFFVDSTGTQVGSAYLGSKSKTEWNDIIVQMLEEAQK